MSKEDTMTYPFCPECGLDWKDCKCGGKRMTNGLHIEYSPVNQAWFLMWFEQVLGIGSKWEMQECMKDLLAGSKVRA